MSNIVPLKINSLFEWLVELAIPRVNHECYHLNCTVLCWSSAG